MDTGLFVTESGKTLLRLRQDPATEFSVPVQSLQTPEMLPAGDPHWTPDLTKPLGTLPPGLVEDVEPKCYW